jgi:A/G-specific adenine glycosylase
MRKITALVPLMLDWFARNARDLPWRKTRDPYAIWVSEVMLQQTQVKTVIPYWERWMRELPTVRVLAGASSGKVHKLWEGLGYYARARNLHRAARGLVAARGGRFPERFDEVLALPGVGRYTAGAICSIAFHQPTPVLDGNLMRVLTRVFGIAGDPRKPRVNARLWRIAEALVWRAAATESRTLRRASRLPPSGHACSHLNQSLMELGAVICTPRRPRCALCPVRRHCVARRQARVAELPHRDRRPVSTLRRFAAFVVRHRGRWLVRQRPAGVVNAHLWELPNTEVIRRRLDVRELGRQVLGAPLASVQHLVTVRHTLTRYRITLDVLAARLRRQPKTLDPSRRWVTLRALDTLAFAGAHRKILNGLGARLANRRTLVPRRRRLRLDAP